MGKNLNYATEAVELRFTSVCLCVHVFILTFSAHAHKPMPKNAAPSNCKTKAQRRGFAVRQKAAVLIS